MDEARIMRIDDRGVIRHWGSGLEEIYGYTSDEAVGRDLNFLIPQPLRSRHWKGLDKALSNGKLHHDRVAHVPALNKSGRLIPVRAQPSLTFDDYGRATGASSLCLGRDPAWLVPIYKAGLKMLAAYDRLAARRQNAPTRPEPS
jgi:PAS domain S-box-containing protein